MKLFVFLLLPVVSCSKAVAVRTHGDEPIGVNGGKPHAPVSVTAVTTDHSADVRVTFEQAATNVDITFAGANGLRVQTGAVAAQQKSYTAGQVETFVVTFDAGAAKSSLATFVSGNFAGGGALNRVVTFPIGAPAHTQAQKPSTTSEGDRVQVLPAQPR